MLEIKSNLTPALRQFALLPMTLAFVTLIFFAPVLLSGNDLGGSDFQQIHYPLLKFIVDSVQNGQVPLWNPHQFLGYSVVGNPQNGLLYPPNWILLLFGDVIYRGVAWLVALHVWWMACGLAVFYRGWGASQFGALIGAIVVAFGGFVGSKIYAGHYAVLMTMAWLPWLLAGYQYATKSQTWHSTFFGGMALGLAILAGHPQFAYIGGIGLGLLWLYRIVVAPDHRSRWLVTRQLGAIVLLGLIFGAGSWWPTLDYQAQTVRGQAQDSLDFANQHAIPPRQLLTLLVPDAFGVPTDDDAGYWGEPFYEEMTAYVGWLPLLLLFLGGFRREKWLAVGLIVLGMIMAVGVNGGLYTLQYYLVPPARGFRAPGRFLLLTSIGLGMIAALGITELQAHKDPTYRRVILILRRVGLPLLIICGGGALVFSLFKDDLADDPQQAIFLAGQLAWSFRFLLAGLAALWVWRFSAQLGIGLIGVVAVLNVMWLSQPLVNAQAVELSPVWQAADVIPTDDYGRIIQVGAPPGIINGPSWTGHYTPQGYDPIAPSGWFELMDATGIYIEDPGSATNRLFGVRYAVAGQPLEQYGFGSAQYFNPVLSDSAYFFYDNPNTLARVYIAHRYDIESNDVATIQRIQQGEVDRGDVVLLPSAPACTLWGDGGMASITDYQPNHVTISVEADGAGILVLGDQYDPDWRVTVNGEAADLLRVNTTFRGVCVPTGTSTVEFQYRPQAFYFGAIMSAVGWLLVILTLAWAFFWRFVFAK